MIWIHNGTLWSHITLCDHLRSVIRILKAQKGGSKCTHNDRQGRSITSIRKLMFVTMRGIYILLVITENNLLGAMAESVEYLPRIAFEPMVESN